MIRRYTEEDIPAMLDIIARFLSESPSYYNVHYARGKMDALLKAGVNKKSFFCDLAFDGDTLLGGLCADTYEYSFSHEVFGADLLFYITESKRSLRLATGLVDNYVQWGKDRKLREIRLASTTGIEPARFGKLCEHLGFKLLGSIYSMEV